MTKYVVRKYGGAKIESLDVLRETEKFVVLKITHGERRESKTSDYCRYFDDWDSAHAYLLAKAEDRANRARIELSSANGHLGNVKGMKKPQ